MRLAPLFIIPLLAPILGAQAPGTAALEAGTTISGVVRDSIARGPLEGATVQVVAAGRGLAFARSAVTDRWGQFSLGGVPEGRYWIGFLHPMLDSLGIEPPQREVLVVGPGPVPVDLAIPSPASLRATVCGSEAPSDSGAVVLGSVRDARDRLPVAGARVHGEWLELSFGPGGIARRIARMEATTGENGWFALCDVPRAGVMELVASRGTDSTAVIEIQVPRDGFLRRELYFGVPSALASGDPAGPADSLASPVAAQSGSGRLSGTVVRAIDAYPLAGVRVSIIDGPQTMANDQGEWTLTGIPLGTRMLDIRAVGYYPERRPVDVIEGARPIHVALSTIRDVLDTVLISAARRSDRRRGGFDDRRQSGLGRYLTADDIARRQPNRLSDVFRMIPGLVIQHDAGAMETKILMRGFLSSYCAPALYLDGHYMSVLSADEIDAFVRPPEVMGIEIYSPATVPPQYQQGMGACGSIVIWTKTAT